MNREEVRQVAREVPLFGGLVDCDFPNHREAIGQTFIVLLMSTMPFWLATLIVYGTGNDLSFAAFKCDLYGTIAKGELFMYCTALLAPLFWVVLVDPPGAPAFPSKLSHMITVAVIDVVAAVFFALVVAGRSLNARFSFDMSVAMFLCSVSLLYLATVYHASQVSDAASEFKKQETDFTEAVREHRQ